MDWIAILLFVFLAICVLLIIVTLVSLPQLGDERKDFIKMKAQSFAFAGVIGYLLINLLESIYVTYWTDNTYEGINPFAALIGISLVYLISLLFCKKKYGG
jgi:hypothetical protein